MAGSALRHGGEWKAEVRCETLFDDYVAASEKIGIKRKREQITFGLALQKIMPEPREAKDVSIDDGHGTA